LQFVETVNVKCEIPNWYILLCPCVLSNNKEQNMSISCQPTPGTNTYIYGTCTCASPKNNNNTAIKNYFTS